MAFVKKFLQIFLMTFGVIFILVIIAGVYLFAADPFQIKPLIRSLTGQGTPLTKPSEGGIVVDKNPALSPAQEQALENIGVDPAAIPSSITPAMQKCFYDKLGAKRADELKGGATPTVADFFAARSCL